jgi:hypothetical protein
MILRPGFRGFFEEFSGFGGFFTLVLSFQGGRNQSCLDEQFDVKIIQFCLAYRER